MRAESVAKYAAGELEPGTKMDAEIAALENELESARARMHELRQAELARVSREFIINDYEKKYSISQKQFVAALIGEVSAKGEMERQLKDKEEYNKKQEKHFIFRFGSKASLAGVPQLSKI